MKIKSIVILLACWLLLSGLTVPAIACDCEGDPPAECYRCEAGVWVQYGNCWEGCDDCYSCENCYCDWDCTTGQCCDNDDCVDNCPSGECCDDGTCVSSCPTGECCDDGTCVDDCPSGECCDDGTCVECPVCGDCESCNTANCECECKAGSECDCPGKTCTGCCECESCSCADKNDNCTSECHNGCSGCSCVDDESKCPGECDTCDDGTCTDHDYECNWRLCETCNDGKCEDRCPALGKYCDYDTGMCEVCVDDFHCEFCEQCNVLHECEPMCEDGEPTGECDTSHNAEYECVGCVLIGDCSNYTMREYYGNEVHYCFTGGCPGDCVQQDAVECYVVYECKRDLQWGRSCQTAFGVDFCITQYPWSLCEGCTKNPDKWEPIVYRYPTRCP